MFPGGLLHRDDLVQLAQPLQGVGEDVARGPTGHVVDHDGEAGMPAGAGPVVLEEPGLVGLVVVGRDHQRGVGAGVSHAPHLLHGLGGGVAARPGDDRHPPLGLLHHQADGLHPLHRGHGHRLPGGPHRHQARGATGELLPHQGAVRPVVERSVPEGSGERGQRTLELHHRAGPYRRDDSPRQRSSIDSRRRTTRAVLRSTRTSAGRGRPL